MFGPLAQLGLLAPCSDRYFSRFVANSTLRLALVGLAWLPATLARADEPAPVDFNLEIRPLLASACVHCHQPDRAEGELMLHTLSAMQIGGDGAVFVAGDPDASSLFTTTVLPPDDELRMPPEGAPLNTWQTDRLRDWIAQGAKWEGDERIAETPRVDFVKHVQPILETNCLACHRSDKAEGGLDLSTQATAFADSDSGKMLLPFHADESELLGRTLLDKSDEGLMPPANQGGPLAPADIEILRQWIAQGANWPDGVTLQQKARVVFERPTPDTMEFVERLHALIVETAEKEAAAGSEFADYQSKVPRTGADYSMVAIEGGSFLMGSPETEADRRADEGPQVEVTVAPFWMGRYEVTWNEYEPYMINGGDRFKWGALRNYDAATSELVDAVSQPTAPYTEMSFGMGQRGYPAISMTHHAANKYCEWLSAQTGHFYRLPTEAEWEYACRAGTTTAFSFGDDPAELGRYAWFYDNSNEKYQKVGLKEPNPWGLYDMHGNVMEWCADQYVPEYFAQIRESAVNPLIRVTTEYPNTVRGGGWDDDPENLRSAARRASDASWKAQDPQLPKSLWYHTNAKWLGFRIVRPAEIPSAEEMYYYWNSASKF